jgi:hypothetical protein
MCGSRDGRRATDRIADAVAWLLTALALLAVVPALALGARLYTEGMHRASLETAEYTQVEAVLVEPAPIGLQVGETGRTVRAIGVPVPALYTASDGVGRRRAARRRARCRTVACRSPGAVWLDRAGDVTTAPTGRFEAMRTGLGRKSAVPDLGVVGWAIVVLAYTSARHLQMRAGMPCRRH